MPRLDRWFGFGAFLALAAAVCFGIAAALGPDDDGAAMTVGIVLIGCAVLVSITGTFFIGRQMKEGSKTK